MGHKFLQGGKEDPRDFIVELCHEGIRVVSFTYGRYEWNYKCDSPSQAFLIPYVSGYIENYSGQSGVATSYNGGLDIKLGLSESFTLDATLIPDFGQVESDEHILNLTPYEVKYNEKRPFFMEGTELFNKEEIFYSRRIGGTPRLYDDVYDYLESDEAITRHPSEVQLINATKISGRTKEDSASVFSMQLHLPCMPM